MSDWRVQLEFVEGGSSKFWRARTDGGTLYVNFGRIGTGGQTQVKELGSPGAAEKELEKLIREKRKKGYADAGSAGASGGDEGGQEDEDEGDEDEDERPKKSRASPPPPLELPRPPAQPTGPVTASFAFDRSARKVQTRVTLDGATVRLEAHEAYGDPESARQAYERLKAALGADGHTETG